MQVSPSGMAAASQAASGEFDSRHLLQNLSLKKARDFCIKSALSAFSQWIKAQKNFSAFDKAFPPGGRCRRTATDEGRSPFLIV